MSVASEADDNKNHDLQHVRQEFRLYYYSKHKSQKIKETFFFSIIKRAFNNLHLKEG